MYRSKDQAKSEPLVRFVQGQSLVHSQGDRFMSTKSTEDKVEEKGSLLQQGIEFLRTCDRTWLFLAIAATLAVGLVSGRS